MRNLKFAKTSMYLGFVFCAALSSSVQATESQCNSKGLQDCLLNTNAGFSCSNPTKPGSCYDLKDCSDAHIKKCKKDNGCCKDIDCK